LDQRSILQRSHLAFRNLIEKSDEAEIGAGDSANIYGDIVVWTDDNNGKNNVFMRDIAKHKTTQITKVELYF